MTRALVAAALALAACGPATVDGPRLAADQLPAELHGLVVGTATEADVRAIWPDAELKRDTRLGGPDDRIELNDVAAIVIRTERVAEAWLVGADGGPRLAALKLKLARPCVAVMADFGKHLTPQRCLWSNRVAGPDEHEACTATPDGKHRVEINCEGTWLEMSVFVKGSPAHSWRG